MREFEARGKVFLLLCYNLRYYIHMAIAEIEGTQILALAQPNTEKVTPVCDLRAIEARNTCRELEAPYEALRQIRVTNPTFWKGLDLQVLGYTLFTINPNEVDKIARILKTDRRTLGVWFSHLREVVTDEEWTTFEQTTESLEQSVRKTTYVSSQLWQPSEPLIGSLLEPLGPGLKALVEAALTSSSYPELQARTNHTYKGARQRLSQARKIIEARLAPQGYVRMKETDEEVLSVSMGSIPYLKIGETIYIREVDQQRVTNRLLPQSNPIPEPLPAFKRERVKRPAPFKSRPTKNIKELIELRKSIDES